MNKILCALPVCTNSCMRVFDSLISIINILLIFFECIEATTRSVGLQYELFPQEKTFEPLYKVYTST